MTRSQHPPPWLMLTLSTLGQAASAVVINGPAFLIPALHLHGMSLPEAGLVAAASVVGGTATLIPWGVAVDRIGERTVLATSLGIAAVVLAAATLAHESTPVMAVFFLLAGAAAAGTGSASGRVVVGWFPARRRGLAMGVRQMAQPAGVGIAAILVPVLAHRHGLGPAIGALTAIAGVAAIACALGVVDPPRPERQTSGIGTDNPYRGETYLAQIHLVSALLVVPQYLVWTYMLVWLQVGRGWAPAAAGALVGVTQLLGAIGRIGAGHLSDRVGSRMRPLRWIAVAAAGAMLLLGGATAAHWWSAVPLIVIASVITVADNGLAFTAVAEHAGPFWSGRALGIQNTGQYLTAAAVPPIAGWLIATSGYAATFALSAAAPAVAVLLIPPRDRPNPHGD